MSAPGPVRAAENTRADWETPADLFALCDREFHFELDGAANWENRKCTRFLGLDFQDVVGSPHLGEAFTRSLKGWNDTIWLNPPWGRGLKQWMDLVASWRESNTIGLLLPASTGPEWFRKLYGIAHEIRFLEGRPQFIHAPHCACKACAEGKRGSNVGDALFAVLRPGRLPVQPNMWLWDWRSEIA